MGMSMNTYFGPFFLCTGTTKEVTLQQTVCASCNKIQTTKFCPICGSEVITKDIQNVINIHIDPNDHNEDLFNPYQISSIFYCADNTEMNNVHVFLPNKKFGNNPQFVNEGTSTAMLVENNMISNECMINISSNISEFNKKFGKHKPLLEAHYKTVEVCYGLIHYQL